MGNTCKVFANFESSSINGCTVNNGMNFQTRAHCHDHAPLRKQVYKNYKLWRDDKIAIWKLKQARAEYQIHEILVYLQHAVRRPDSKSDTLSIYVSRCTNCRKQRQAYSTEPRQDHTHFGHPRAIVLPVSNEMDELEVTFEGDYHESEFFRRHSDRCKSCTQYDNAKDIVRSRVAQVYKVVAEHCDASHDQTYAR